MQGANKNDICPRCKSERRRLNNLIHDGEVVGCHEKDDCYIFHIKIMKVKK